MAARIHAAGLSLTVWNRTASRMAPFADLGVGTAGTAADLARDHAGIRFTHIPVERDGS